MTERAKLVLEWDRRWDEAEGGRVDVAELARLFGVSRQTWLLDRYSGREFPSASCMGMVLKRGGLSFRLSAVWAACCLRSDNGPPFASTGPASLTTLSVWWLRLGIGVERIEPRKPQQNGRQERFHRTLKFDVTPRASFRLQQRAYESIGSNTTKAAVRGAWSENSSFCVPSLTAPLSTWIRAGRAAALQSPRSLARRWQPSLESSKRVHPQRACARPRWCLPFRSR
jgi:hypothetical protein